MTGSGGNPVRASRRGFSQERQGWPSPARAEARTPPRRRLSRNVRRSSRSGARIKAASRRRSRLLLISRLWMSPRRVLAMSPTSCAHGPPRRRRGCNASAVWRQSPFTRHHVVAGQVPPEIVVQLLRPAIDLPAAEDIERLAVHDEDAGRPFRVVLTAAAKRANIITGLGQKDFTTRRRLTLWRCGRRR